MKRTIMKSHPIVVLLLVAAVVVLSSCGPYRASYRLTCMDTFQFDHNVLHFTSSTGQDFMVLTDTLDKSVDTEYGTGWQELRLDSTYELVLKELRRPPEMEYMIRSCRIMFGEIYVCCTPELIDEDECGVLFWERGKFYTRVFASDNLRGTCVR